MYVHSCFIQCWYISVCVNVSNSRHAKRHGSDDTKSRTHAEYDVFSLCAEYDEPDGAEPGAYELGKSRILCVYLEREASFFLLYYLV